MRRMLRHRLTVSTAAVAVVLVTILLVSFGLIYRASFTTFVGFKALELDKQSAIIAQSLRPALQLMGAHQQFALLIPGEMTASDVSISLDRPSWSSFPASSVVSGGGQITGHIESTYAMRTRTSSGEFLFVGMRLSANQVRIRTLHPGPLTGADYLVVRITDSQGAIANRFITFENPGSPSDRMLAQAAAYPAPATLMPELGVDAARDLDVRGGVYRDGEDNRIILLRWKLADAIGNPVPITAETSPVRMIAFAWGSNAEGRASYLVGGRDSVETSSRLCGLVPQVPAVPVTTAVEDLKLQPGAAVPACDIPVKSKLTAPKDFHDCESGSMLLRLHCWLISSYRLNIRTLSLLPGASVNDLLTVHQPVDLGDGYHAQLIARRSLDGVAGEWKPLGESLIAAALLATFGVLTFAAVVYLTVIRRITKLARQVAAAAQGNPPQLQTTELQSPDEIGTLAQSAQTFVRSNTVQTIRLNRQRDRLTETARRIRHDLRVPLERLQVLLTEGSREIKLVRTAIRLMNDLIEEQHVSANMESCSLKQFVTEWIDNTQHERPETRPIVFQPPAAACKVQMDRERLDAALEHVVENACDFRLSCTAIEVSIVAHEYFFAIRVFNRGPLIEPNRIDSIFSSGTSLRSTQDGKDHMGEGLYQVRRYLDAMGGRVQAENVDNSGVAIILSLTAAALEEGGAAERVAGRDCGSHKASS